VSESDLRPPVWVGHVTLTTDRLGDSHQFMVDLGMRPIAKGDDFAVLELRAGTHLVLMKRGTVEAGVAPFDLMVEDLDATHRRLAGLGLSPSEIAEGRIHRSFTVIDPGGHVITFNSSHVSDQPV
jgi:catechol 2,3-dioxygenase-like lactoylglutathione lyase family enzyme